MQCRVVISFMVQNRIFHARGGAFCVGCGFWKKSVVVRDRGKNFSVASLMLRGAGTENPWCRFRPAPLSDPEPAQHS
jgi:hypothetical protein